MTYKNGDKYDGELINEQKLLDIFSLELTTLYQTSLHGGSIAFIASRQGLRQTDKIIEEYIDKESALFDEDIIFTEFNSKAKKLKENLLKQSKN